MGVTFRISKIGRKFGQRVSTESCDPDSQVSRAPEESESNRSNREIKGHCFRALLKAMVVNFCSHLYLKYLQSMKFPSY